MGRRRPLFGAGSEKVAARAENNRQWFWKFRLPYRIVIDGRIVATFENQRDALGFRKARYPEAGIVVDEKALVELERRMGAPVGFEPTTSSL